MSWKLGRVAGIDVFLHPTFFLLLAYVAMMEGGIGSVLLVSAVFSCVLLHELGHALMARRFGIATEDITLYPIGGVARLRRMPRAPGAELLIALAGPAVNIAIAMALTAVQALGLGGSGSPWSPSLLGLFVDDLILINLGLAFFNLIPAFPMDGGRVLRALLSGWIGRVRATVIAAGIGRGLALLFGLVCLYRILFIPGDSGAFLQAILAGFIYLAAGHELARVLAEEGHLRARRAWTQPDPLAGQGIWTAPPGFRWVSRGNGVWQLAPVVSSVDDRVPPPWR
jgi:Zn-dependent protease